MPDDLRIAASPIADAKRGKARFPLGRPPFECIALLLQGGGALGAYQAGVYEALAEADLQPDWVAGISIGAINAALIAGNAPETAGRRSCARSGSSVTADPLADWCGSLPTHWLATATWRAASSTSSARTRAVLGGAAGLLHAAPAVRPGCIRRARSRRRASTTPRRCKATLERLVDFDRINAGEMRFSVGAVNVRTGNFVYFDNTHPPHPARAHHGERRAAARLSAGRDRRRASIGTAASSPTRRCNGWSKSSRARTRSPSRSTSGARAARCRATSPKSRRGRRKSNIRAARAPTPTSSSSVQRCAARWRTCFDKLPAELRDDREEAKLLQPRPTTRSTTSST